MLPVALLLGLGCAVAMAGVGDVGVPNGGSVENGLLPDEAREEKQRPVGDRVLPKSQGDTAWKKSDSVLRCWQKGKLIFEERDWKPGLGNALPGPVLHTRVGRFDTLRLADFGETFCFLKTRD